MSAHSCDVCQQDAHLACSHCLQAVYCGEACQAADFAEHRDICTHVDELDHNEVLDAVAEHLEDADSDADEAVMQTGYEIIEAQDSNAGRTWIGEALRSDLVGITLGKARKANRSIRRAEKGKAQAAKGGKWNKFAGGAKRVWNNRKAKKAVTTKA